MEWILDVVGIKGVAEGADGRGHFKDGAEADNRVEEEGREMPRCIKMFVAEKFVSTGMYAATGVLIGGKEAVL